jgi:hypothetical protein
MIDAPPPTPPPKKEHLEEAAVEHAVNVSGVGDVYGLADGTLRRGAGEARLARRRIDDRSQLSRRCVVHAARNHVVKVLRNTPAMERCGCSGSGGDLGSYSCLPNTNRISYCSGQLGSGSTSGVKNRTGQCKPLLSSSQVQSQPRWTRLSTSFKIPCFGSAARLRCKLLNGTWLVGQTIHRSCREGDLKVDAIGREGGSAKRIAQVGDRRCLHRVLQE